MYKFISLTISIIIILFNIYAINTQDPCNYENSNGLVTITCVNFQSFDQLNFVNVTDQVREINLKPSQLTLLDSKLDVYSINFMVLLISLWYTISDIVFFEGERISASDYYKGRGELCNIMLYW